MLFLWTTHCYIGCKVEFGLFYGLGGRWLIGGLEVVPETSHSLGFGSCTLTTLALKCGLRLLHVFLSVMHVLQV